MLPKARPEAFIRRLDYGTRSHKAVLRLIKVVPKSLKGLIGLHLFRQPHAMRRIATRAPKEFRRIQNFRMVGGCPKKPEGSPKAHSGFCLLRRAEAVQRTATKAPVVEQPQGSPKAPSRHTASKRPNFLLSSSCQIPGGSKQPKSSFEVPGSFPTGTRSTSCHEQSEGVKAPTGPDLSRTSWPRRGWEAHLLEGFRGCFTS